MSKLKDRDTIAKKEARREGRKKKNHGNLKTKMHFQCAESLYDTCVRLTALYMKHYNIIRNLFNTALHSSLCPSLSPRMRTCTRARGRAVLLPIPFLSPPTPPLTIRMITREDGSSSSNIFHLCNKFKVELTGVSGHLRKRKVLKSLTAANLISSSASLMPMHCRGP